MEFSRQEYWSGLLVPFPGDLPDPGIEPGSPALLAGSLQSEPPGEPIKKLLIEDTRISHPRNLYAGQKATGRTGHGTTDWLQIEKGVHQGCILSPCLFNLYAEYIMRNAGLNEAQAGITIAGRNINNLRYADDTTLNGRKQRTKEPPDESEIGE